MVKFPIYPALLICLLSGLVVFAQESAKISDKKSELKQLKSEINRLEDELKVKTRKEKKSVEMIENINRQNLMLNKVINSIRQEEQQKDEEIGITESQIAKIEKEIKSLKDSYAKYIVYLYKYGREDKLKWLLESESINQALIRNKYLQRITDQRQKDITSLKNKEMELSGLQIALVRERDEKHSIALQKQDEEKNLQVKLKERKSLLASLRNDKASLRKELDLKKKAEGDIRNWISKLIEEEKRKEEIRRKEEAKAKEEARKREFAKKSEGSGRNKPEPEKPNKKDSKEVFESFASRGSLHWPVDNGRIIRRFGENKNAKLNTVTINYGIDIRTNADAGVKAALEGVVSTVNWVPGYGSVLIITHKNGIRTVYGHLGEIFVNEGSRISAGSTIGKVGESLEGNILHFEVWSERSNQNPEHWLSRK